MTKTSKKALVLYYSNSGNTKNLAQSANDVLEDTGWDVTMCSLMDFSGDSFQKPELLVLGTPVHFWAVPGIAREKIRQLPRFDGVNAFVFCTYGNVFSSNVPYVLANELKGKGARIAGGAALSAPHNFMAANGTRLGDTFEMFGKGQPNAGMLAQFKDAVTRVAHNIETGAPGKVAMSRLHHPRKMLVFMDSLFPIKWEIGFLAPVKINPALCKACGTCIENCDTRSITGKDNKPANVASTCIRCYTCARGCPTGALSVAWNRNESLLRGMKKIIKDKGNRIIA